MMDLIERAAAQTELMMKCERYTLARESHGMGHVEWSSDLISVADAMDAIRDLPSAQPEPQWIPVSERLPDEYKRVLVSDVFGVYVGELVDAEEKWGGEHFIDAHGIHSKSVKAWRPLPEPYQEDT